LFIDCFWEKINYDKGMSYSEIISRFISEKRIAVVGCSGLIDKTNFGSYIDSYDVVIRCDDSWIRQRNSDVGHRTDILFHSTSICDMKIFCLHPRVSLVVWLGKENEEVVRANRFLRVLETPYVQIDNPPNHLLTCTNVIDLVWSFDPAELYLVGCDFYSSINPDQEWICSNLLYNPKVVMADHVKHALLNTAIKI